MASIMEKGWDIHRLLGDPSAVFSFFRRSIKGHSMIGLGHRQPNIVLVDMQPLKLFNKQVTYADSFFNAMMNMSIWQMANTCPLSDIHNQTKVRKRDELKVFKL